MSPAGGALEAGPPDAAALDERARIDSVALYLAHWRGTLAALAVATIAAVIVWQEHLPWPMGTAWAAAALLSCGGQALAAWKMERAAVLAEALPRWMPVLLVSTAVSSVVWGSMPWMLSAASAQAALVAGLFNVMLVFCGANAPGTPTMLWCVGLPAALVTTLALVGHAGLRPAGAVCGLMFGLVILYGLRVQAAIRAGMVQRHLAQDLSDALRAQQRRLLELERERAAVHEREQLTRAMHDGLGATLVSSLALAERGQLAQHELAGVLRECIDDVRLVVESLESAEHDLATLLGSLRWRWERRLQAAGLALTWDMGEDLPSLRLAPAAALQVLRIVQEALANVVKHAQARRLSVSVTAEDAVLVLLIEDDGIGCDLQQATAGGRGLRNLRQRAAQLGATLSVSSAPGAGTRVRLALPVPPGTGA